MEKKQNFFSVVLLGPPGSGKSAQALCLSKFFQLKHVDIGMELRKVAQEDTPQGKEIYNYMYKEHSLISDEIIENLLQNDICKRSECRRGIILDGAPRRIGQIERIEKILQKQEIPLLRVISLSVKKESLIKRIKHRYFCPRCFSFYIEGKDIQNAQKDLCPRCQYPLMKREDDTLEGVEKRLNIFEEETLPVIEEYRRKKILLEIDGDREGEIVCQNVYEQITLILREKEYENKNTSRN
ncbi:MAG: nucleoside monophosphate kinase [Candidatus Moraniibacteriota bacterium]|nr:MAG: nucleoside monophosphate kinase [Candidatus Moranbacteria bacterium]